MKLKGCVVSVKKLTANDIGEMYELMAEFYTNIERKVFLQDLYEKEYCAVLRDVEGIIRGFSTQKMIHFSLNGEDVHGIFSGDTIIHKKYWGSLEIFRTLIHFFFDVGGKYEEFYWFIVVKGYKTYKILPTFFKEFYPNYHTQTPPQMQMLMDGFGENFYPDEYNKKSGVLEYTTIKDTLKDGVADVTEKRLKDKDVQFFCEKNPGYVKGNDLVCITKLSKDNLQDKVLSHLLVVKDI